MNKTVRDIIESYVPKNKAAPEVLDENEENFIDDEEFFDDEELDEEVTDQIINDITELYNDADEETQNMLDEMIETEEGLEKIVSAIYEEDCDDEEDEDEDEDEEDVKEEIQDADFENIQELKTSTLVSYVGKAANDVASNSAATRDFANKSKTSRENHQFMKARHEDEAATKYFMKSLKRKKGIQAAVKKIANRTIPSAT